MLIAGTYMAGMEGAVSISVSSNYNARIEQIWPPVWEPDKEPETFVEKMQVKAKQAVLKTADAAVAGAAAADAKIKEAKKELTKQSSVKVAPAEEPDEYEDGDMPGD